MPLQNKLVPTLLAAVITASSGSAVIEAFYPAPARADVEVDEEVRAGFAGAIAIAVYAVE